MTVEQALRWLASQDAELRFSTTAQFATLRIRCGGRTVSNSVNLEGLLHPSLAVLSWQLVSLTLKLQRNHLMGAVAKRFKELHDNLTNDAPATLADLADLAAIVDDELEKVQQSMGIKREDASELVKAYGQTETKEPRPSTESIRSA